MSDADPQQRTERRSTMDAIVDCLTAEPCPLPDCDGVLQPDEYKDTPAIVCDRCAVPAARVWGDGT